MLFITEQKLSNTILWVSTNKTFNLNRILNKILHLALSQLLSLLLSLYNLCLEKERYLNVFKQFITVILWKFNKSDYQQTKMYRSVTLLNTLKKALKLIITQRISYMTEIHNLLFKILLNERKTVSIKYIIHMLLKQIQRV